MNFIDLFVIYIFFSIIDYFIIKFEIKFNIDLFYALHKKMIDKQLLKMEENYNENF